MVSMAKEHYSTAMPSGEPQLVIPALAPFYAWARVLSYPLMRITIGGILLVHGNGIEPSLPIAYLVFFNETIGAICLILGLFTRPIAASIAIEMAVITFVVHFKNGFAFSSQGGGWEFPLMWGLLVFAIALRGGGPYSLDRKLGKEI